MISSKLHVKIGAGRLQVAYQPYTCMKAIFFEEPIESYFLPEQLTEVYKEQIYQPYVGGKKDLTILEIGANIGISTFYFSHYAKRVVSVEPSPDHFKLLSEMVKFNKLDNVTLINKAVYIENGEFEFSGPDNNKTMTSLHAAVWQPGTNHIKVPTITLDTLFDEQKIDHCDLLNVDIEGSEFELFASEGFLKVAPKVQTIITERHSWAGRHPQQLIESLMAAGFKVTRVPSAADTLVARKI